jgi:hypothetical protein
MPTHSAGSSSVLAAPTASTSTEPATTTPTNQPTRNANPLALARELTSMSTTATMGIGLSRTPIAMGNDCPTAAPTALPTLDRLTLHG